MSTIVYPSTGELHLFRSALGGAAMSVNRLLLLVAILLASTVVASASIIPRPGDPDIIIDAGGLSDPLTTGTIFPGGTGTFDYYNPFSVFITGLTFEIMIAPNL